MNEAKAWKIYLNILKGVSLLNVLATIMIFSLWLVNGYQPLPIVALVWGLYFLVGNYNKFKVYKSVQIMSLEDLKKEYMETLKQEDKKDV